MSQLPLITFLGLLSNIHLSFPTTLEEQFIKISQTRHKRQLTYPYGSAIGMYLAFAVPLDLPEQDVLFSYNFEANYNLPNNLEQYALNSITPSRTLRSINRASVFQYIENFLNRNGLHGRHCLLRTICEVKQSHLSHNGILGHIINIIFTPSTTVAEKVDEEFTLAEKIGEHNAICSELFSDCKYSLLDLISVFEN